MNTAPIFGEDLREQSREARGTAQREGAGGAVRRRVTAKSVVAFGSVVSVLPKLPVCFQHARVDADSLCRILRKWT